MKEKDKPHMNLKEALFIIGFILFFVVGMYCIGIWFDSPRKEVYDNCKGICENNNLTLDHNDSFGGEVMSCSDRAIIRSVYLVNYEKGECYLTKK